MNDKLELVILSALSDKPKYLLGANFGPFINNEFVDYYKNVFNKYDDVCFRDYKSYFYFHNLPRIRYEKDIVFSLNQNKVEKEKGSIGFSIIDLMTNKPTRNERKKYTHNYITTIIEITKRIMNEQCLVYFFSFCQRGGDEKAIEFVLRKLPYYMRKKINIIKYNGDLGCFIREYMKMEKMIVTRFHAMILSLIFNQYMYPFIYDQKMSNVLADLQYNDGYSAISDIENVDIILNKLNTKNFLLPLESVKKSSSRQFEKLAQFINNNDGIL
jgi:colanic acid/amylovoran biosynthesis protein